MTWLLARGEPPNNKTMARKLNYTELREFKAALLLSKLHPGTDDWDYVLSQIVGEGKAVPLTPEELVFVLTESLPRNQRG